MKPFLSKASTLGRVRSCGHVGQTLWVTLGEGEGREGHGMALIGLNGKEQTQLL